MLDSSQCVDTVSDRERFWRMSVEMLLAILDGATYESVAVQRGLTRTGVERRITAVAVQVAVGIGIDGLNEHGVTNVHRLRQHREALVAALRAIDMQTAASVALREAPILDAATVEAGAQRIRARSQHVLEDLALYYLLFATGARPLEIARLEVPDYLLADGNVRQDSQWREATAINGRSRPLFFRSAALNQALDAYLEQRLIGGFGLGKGDAYRGLDPTSRLFLSPGGRGFEINSYGTGGQRRFSCRAILETYRKLFRYAEFKQVTALTVRHTVVDRLYARGADEGQVGMLLGIAERSAVRKLFPRRRPSLEDLTEDLV